MPFTVSLTAVAVVAASGSGLSRTGTQICAGVGVRAAHCLVARLCLN